MCCLFRLSLMDIGRQDEHAGSVEELFVSFSELVGSMCYTERMIRQLFAVFTVQHSIHKVETLSKMSYLLFICLHIASTTTLS